MSVIDEPAAALAAERCLTARSLDDHGITRRHPRRCGWCDIPLGELAVMVRGFNDWAGYNPRSGSYARYDVQEFLERLIHHRAEAEAEIVAAQDLVPETPEPVQPAPAPVADAPPPVTEPEEEALRWLV